MLPKDTRQAAPRRGIYRNILIAFLLLAPGTPGYSASAPTVAGPAAANPNPVTGTSTALSVLGTDDSGGTDLTYTWSATGPSPVAFSSNGTNSSNNITATFQAAGSYVLQVLIQNNVGLTATSGISVTVNPTVTKVAVNPPSATVTSHANQQFTASILDQFGNPIAQPNEPVGWTDLANTVLQNACPPNNYGGENYNYYTLCPNVINAWSGGIADTLRNRMIIWGGGHQNYSGNEVFSLNLNTNPPAFQLLTEPSFFNPNNQVCPDANADGTPVSRETYDGLVYLPTVDRMFSFAGDKAPCATDSGTTWTLDLSVSPPAWHLMDPVNGFNPAALAANGSGSVTGALCAYDPNTDSVFCSWGNQNGLLQYTYKNNTWKALAPIQTDIVAPASTAVVDPVRRLLIFIGTLGDGVSLRVSAIDISGADPTYALHDWTSQFSACSGMAGIWPGVAYDPVLDRIVEWPGTGNTVYLINTATKTCVAQTFPGGPQIGPGINNGTFGRFRYFPELNAYVVVNNAELDAQMLRLDTTSLGWAVEGSGYVSGSGVLTAGNPGTAATITADVGGVTGTATVTVVPDTTPPSVSITAPSNQSTVSGIVTVTANATDDASIIDLQFQLDGITLGPLATGAGPSYSYSWNTAALFNGAQLVNGPHVLTAIATDASGNTTVSSPVTVTLNNVQGLRIALQLHADQTEVSGVANGSVVTPSTAPNGFTGAVVVNGTGSVNFTPAETGNGAYFLNCCVNGNNAYYHFTGSTLGNIFNTSQGQIAFYLKSSYSFAQRAANASTPRYAFDVRDGNGSHLFFFLTQVSGGLLFFNYAIGGATQYTSLQPGTEDATFGNGVILKVQMTWSAGVMNLYLNNALVESTSYNGIAPNWNSASIFDFGALEFQTFGGFYSSDDVIDEFTVATAPTGDTTPPVVSITAPANGSYVNGGAIPVTANATDNVGVTGVQFNVDGANLGGPVTGAGPTYTTSWNSTTAINGPHTLNALATDAAGNTSISSITVTMDNIPPVVSMTAPANGSYVSGIAVPVTATATDNTGVTGVTFKLDGVSLGAAIFRVGSTYSAVWNTTGISGGSHTLSAMATDAAGNTATSTVSITTGGTAPSISITAPANASYVNGGVITVTANATASAGVTGVQFKLDGANLGAVVIGSGPTYNFSWNTAGVKNGPHSLSAVATDAAGNTATATLSVTMDATPPTVSVTAPGNGSYVNGGTVTVTATATDTVGITGVQFNLDGVNLGAAVIGAGPTYSISWNTAAVANGPHTLNAIATDAAGNSATGSISVTMDNTPPSVSMTAPASGSYVNGGVITVSATATDSAGMTGVQFKLDGVNLGAVVTGVGPAYSVSWNSTGVANGPHTLSAVATDAAGNTATGSISVTMDNTPPSVSMTAPASGSYVNGGVITLSATATDSAGVTGVQFKLDGVTLGAVVTGAGPAYSVSWNSAGVANGPHTLSAVATDAAGNTATASVPVAMDTTPPAVSITAPANPAYVNGGVITLSAIATDSVGVTGVQFLLDGASIGAVATGAGSAYSASWNTAGLAGGTHTLSAVATDTAKNNATSSVSVIMDTTPPTVSLTAPATGSSVNGMVTITANASDNTGISGVQFAVDGANIGSAVTGSGPSYSYSWNSLGSANGSHTLSAVAIDLAGNATTSANTSVTVNNPLLLLHLDQTEVSGVTNGSMVTPSIAPAGFTGAVVANGTGSLNYTPAETGNGVYFLNCCVNSNNAYYRFSGSTVGNVFNMSQGQITFYLKSRYSFAQRIANAAGPRYAFDVRDGSGNHLFYFLTQVSGGLLFFNYGIGGMGTYTYLQPGTEDAQFGNGAILQVRLTWSGNMTNLYLNGSLVKSAPYTAATANWSSGSVFDIGAYEYQTYGGFYGLDDVIDEFMVVGPTTGLNSPPPVLTMTSPANGATVGGTVTVTANATDNVGVTGVQFQLDGTYVTGPVTVAGPSYSYSWNSKAATNGPHTLTAIATDTAGNTATSSVSVTVINDTTPPAVTITAPVNGATVNGTLTATANATDNVGVSGVQFTLDGVTLGPAITGAGPTYSYSWNTAGVTNGPHTLGAVATDTAGNTAASSIALTVSNAIVPPAISGVTMGTVTSSTATITWATDKASNSQVAYGTTSSYGSLSALNATLATSHSVTITGLAASTTYYYQVQSQAAQGGIAMSGGFSFTTAASALGPQPLLQMHLDQTEVTGVTNGSVVTPSIAPAGFTGAVASNGTGSVNFSPAQTGNGVYFLNCCLDVNNAYYKFTGSTLGNIFNVNQGQITFSLKSRYTFAQRGANASSPRYAFDVRDGNGNHLFYFLTQVSGGLLFFNYAIAGTAQYAYLPAGTEDATFGSGMVLQVQLSWNAGVTNLYLNGTLVKSAPYSIPASNWSAASVFDVGAYEYQTYGGFYGLDDVIDEFTVTGPAVGLDTTPPSVTMTAPANGAAVSGTVTLTATATDNVAVTGVQFQLDGANLAGTPNVAGSTYTYSWNSKTVSNGSHTLTAVATDAAGNTASGSVAVTVNNNTTPPVVTITTPANGAKANGTVTLTATATDSVGVSGVQFQLDGANLGGVLTNAGPSYTYSWDTTTAANGPHTVAAIASDTAGNTASAGISVTVSNSIVPPVISAVTTGTVTSSTATITWTTDKASNSQVAYGTTATYGTLSPLNTTLVTSHSVTLTGLAASTTYYYQAQSQATQGSTATSPGFTFTTTPASVGPQPLLQMHLDQTEVSGVTSGSVVTPSIGPAGFTGAVVVNGTGSVNFAPAQTGNGVYFLNCCVNANNAYYKFTGSTVGNLFNASQGQITFYVKSRYSFAQRSATASSPRYAFDVRDGNGNHLFYFLTQVSGGYLFFNYGIAGSAQYSYLQPGTEDATFGNGVVLQVKMTWSGGVTNLFLNGALVKSAPYSTPAANWSAASVFDLGAYEYQTYGGFYGLDDVIDEITILPTPQ